MKIVVKAGFIIAGLLVIMFAVWLMVPQTSPYALTYVMWKKGGLGYAEPFQHAMMKDNGIEKHFIGKAKDQVEKSVPISPLPDGVSIEERTEVVRIIEQKTRMHKDVYRINGTPWVIAFDREGKCVFFACLKGIV